MATAALLKWRIPAVVQPEYSPNFGAYSFVFKVVMTCHQGSPCQQLLTGPEGWGWHLLRRKTGLDAETKGQVGVTDDLATATAAATVEVVVNFLDFRDSPLDRSDPFCGKRLPHLQPKAAGCVNPPALRLAPLTRSPRSVFNGLL